MPDLRGVQYARVRDTLIGNVARLALLGAALRDLPLLERKQRLARLLGRAKRQAIHFSEHVVDDGPTVFRHVCDMGLEGIVSKRTDAPYRSGPSKTRVKSKNPESAAVRREREEEWR